LFCGERGIILNDPQWDASNEKHLIRFAHSDFYFHSSSLKQAWLGCLKTKIPLARDVFHLAEKEGLFSMIPWGRTLHPKLLLYSFHS
jgi:hypothetical protein